jgi:hypothetical protein
VLASEIMVCEIHGYKRLIAPGPRPPAGLYCPRCQAGEPKYAERRPKQPEKEQPRGVDVPGVTRPWFEDEAIAYMDRRREEVEAEEEARNDPDRGWRVLDLGAEGQRVWAPGGGPGWMVWHLSRTRPRIAGQQKASSIPSRQTRRRTIARKF